MGKSDGTGKRPSFLESTEVWLGAEQVEHSTAFRRQEAEIGASPLTFSSEIESHSSSDNPPGCIGLGPAYRAGAQARQRGPA